jgi:glycosyltransferase involved in cell wall biosynthesis
MRLIEEVVPLILVSNDDLWLPYVLKAVAQRFGRYVIYDVGSKDDTPKIIEDFIRVHPNADIYHRKLPMVPREVQGCFRNSMIAEARSDWYFQLDGDEVYTKKSVDGIVDAYPELVREYELTGTIYGKVRRIEINDDLQTAYGVERKLPHHRFYHRSAIWDGGHPGEAAHYDQNSVTERWMEDDITCYHFHNCRRSSTSDEAALLRGTRKTQETYRRGEKVAFDAFKHIPALTKRVNSYRAHPRIEEYLIGVS